MWKSVEEWPQGIRLLAHKVSSMLYHLQSLFSFVFKRIRTQPGLTSATLLGLTVVVALMMSGTLYAEGAYGQLLAEEIESVARRTNRPPFTYQFSYDGQQSLPWEDVRQVHQYLSRSDDALLGLPPKIVISHVESDLFPDFPVVGEQLWRCSICPE